jgi:5-(carboxyamino)imidazole ribonucleotide synthase
MNRTVGIIGGGQLARMTHQAAIALGIDVVVLCPEPDEPAVRAGARWCPGVPDDLEDLRRLAESVDVVTLEHEATPPELLDELVALGHRVAPGSKAARLGRDKAAARAALAPRGVPVAPWVVADDHATVEAFGRRHGWPLVLKAPSGGYDGRGVWMAPTPADARRILADVARPLLVEPHLAFRHELAVLVVRSGRGESVAYPPVETVQRRGTCAEVFVPASAPEIRNAQARRLAVTIAEQIDLVGTMAVELFETPDGLLLNELAVRPHNSAHLTIEACATSQFENHLRAVAGLPLGATDLVVPAAAMANVLGRPDGSDPFAQLARALSVPGARVHCYAKDARPSRKLGHITAVAPSVAEARATTARALGALAPGQAA